MGPINDPSSPCRYCAPPGRFLDSASLASFFLEVGSFSSAPPIPMLVFFSFGSQVRPVMTSPILNGHFPKKVDSDYRVPLFIFWYDINTMTILGHTMTLLSAQSAIVLFEVNWRVVFGFKEVRLLGVCMRICLLVFSLHPRTVYFPFAFA